MALQDTLSRADEVLAERTRRELAKMRAEDAATERAEREQAMADSHKRVEIAAKYQDAFASFGEDVPMAIADERPGAFRKRLYETLRRRLPSDHNLSDVRADDISGVAARNFEQMMLEAARAEGYKPSVENLPPGREIVRHRVDENSGAKSTEFFARESFIKGLNQVVRILNPKTGQVLMGPPMSRVETTNHYSPY